MPKYLGPSDVFIHDDKWYRIGDNIPLSKAEVEHHVMFGHQFEGNEETGGVVVGFTPAPPEPMPFDDRGQQMTPPRRERAVPAAKKEG